MSAAKHPPEDAGARIADVIDLAAARGDQGMHRLMQLLARNKDGAVLATHANMLLILAHDPVLKGILGFDEFTGASLLMRAPPAAEDGARELPGPYPRQWGAEDVVMILAYTQRIWSPSFKAQTVEQAMLAAAHNGRFHPVRDWLAALKWDGTSRINTWLLRAFGAPDDEYHRAVGAKFLVAAVRRIRQPGIKFDTVPVLEGGQGIGKSSAIKELFSEQWFSDSMPPDLAGKDAAMALMGVWGLELAELDQLIRNEAETIKAFLSRATDRYRPPYGKTYVERPRQGVIIGTTNSQDYLRDATGNRRIWPVKCQYAEPAWVAENREQLWAEAAAREAAGEAIWLDDADIAAAAVAHQRERMEEDVWTQPVRTYLLGSSLTTTPAILENGLGIPKERQSKREEMRVSKILTADGWRREVEWHGGKSLRVWKR